MKRTSDSKSETLTSSRDAASSALFSSEAGGGRKRWMRRRKRKGGGGGGGGGEVGEGDKSEQMQQAALSLEMKEKKSERKSFFPTLPVLRLMTQVEVYTELSI